MCTDVKQVYFSHTLCIYMCTPTLCSHGSLGHATRGVGRGGDGGGDCKATEHGGEGTPDQEREEEEEEVLHAAAARSPRPATAPVMRHFLPRPPRAPAARPKGFLPALPPFALYHANTLTAEHTKQQYGAQSTATSRS